MKRRYGVMIMLVLISLSMPLSSSQAQTGEVRAYDTWTVSVMRDIREEMGAVLAVTNPQYAYPDDPMFANGEWDTVLLSPAGDVLVGMGWFYDSELSENGDIVCRYEIAAGSMTCAAIEPREAAFRPALMQTAWSLDGTKIAMHEDSLFKRFDESDLWVLDVETLTFTNLTDDGVYGNLSRPKDEPYELDTLPIWTPNGDLYFFRLVDDPDGRRYTLFRLPQAQGELELVLSMPDLNDEFDLSLRVYVALSPDGTRVAVLPHRFSYPVTRGLWMIDLDAFTVEEVVSAAALQVGFPDWSNREADFEQGIGLIPQQVTWSDDGQTVVLYGTPDFVPSPVPGTFNFLAVDVDTKTVTSLIDYNVYEDEAAVYASGSVLPRMGLLAPDGGTLFFLPQLPMADDLALYAVPVALDADPVVVESLTSDQYEALTHFYDRYRHAYTPQTGANGNVLCGSMLFTLE